MAKKNVENSLIEFLSQNIKKDNKTKEELIKKIEKSVEQFVKEHKKEFEALDPVSYTHLTSSTYLIRKISEKKYAKTSLINAITKNLIRAPGNLGEEEKMFEMYNVLEDFDFQCPYSDTLLIGGEQPIHIDHIIPVSLGGPTDDWNCIPVCGTCNMSKNNKHLLDWWEEKHTTEEEYKLVRIFEHMTSKLLEKKNIKLVTTLTDEQIKQVQAEENEDYSNDEEITRLDVITFLFQMLKHFEANKQYLIEPSDLLTAEQTQKALEDKLIKLTKTFNLIFKRNQRTNNAKTDIELLNEQKQMVERLKQWGIISHYKIAYNHFDELQQMIELNMPEEEIKQFCYDKDHVFNIDKFIEELQTFIREHDGRYPNPEAEDVEEKKLGGKVQRLRRAKVTSKLDNEIGKKLDSVGFLWKALRFDTDKFIQELQIFIEQHGRYPNMISKNFNERGLGCQVNRLRQDKKNGDLDREVIQKLDSIGFLWKSARSFNIDKFIEDLQTFLLEHDGRYPSAASKDRKEKKLAGQVGNLRQAKKGKHNLAFNNIIENKLNSIDFIWDADNKFDIDKFIEDLQTFLREHEGKYPRTGSEDNQEQKLAGQVNYLRQSKKGNIKNILDEKTEKKLNAIGFVWNAKKIFNIDNFIENLQTFIEKNGKYPSMESENIEEKKLGRQVGALRLAKRGKGTTRLTSEMIQKLNAIRFVWEVDRSLDIDKFIERLQVFLREHNGKYPRQAAGDSAEQKLSNLVQRIRQAAKGKGNLALDDTMKDKLDAIGFVWEVRKKKVEEKVLSM